MKFAFRLLTVLTAMAVLGAAKRPAPVLSAAPAPEIIGLYEGRLRTFMERTTRFRGPLDSLLATPAGRAALRDSLEALRDAYKDIEFLLEYLQPEIAREVNGAPFDHAEFVPGYPPARFPPQGMQILLRKIEADDAYRNRDSIWALAVWLEAAAQEAVEEQVFAPLDDRKIFGAMQGQVIRVMTQGITGFDSPPHRSLPESRRSLEALRPALGLYRPALTRRSPALAARLSRALDKAVRDLRGDFDAFDRLEYIRAAGNPLYAALVDAQQALGISGIPDWSFTGRKLPVSVNPAARNLFDPRFIDVDAYGRDPGEKFDSAEAALGRRIFFDSLLSFDGKRSCASCHDPRRAFTDGLVKSPAFGGAGTLRRNTPSVSHAAFQTFQFWDMRANTLDQQALVVILGADEFHNSVPGMLKSFRAHPAYPAAFRAAFTKKTRDAKTTEDSSLSERTVTQALAMYLRSLPNGRTAFDRYARGETAFIDPAVRRGFNLFMGKALCATCHFPPLFNGLVPPAYRETEGEVLGVPETFPAERPVLDADLGRYEIHPLENLRRAFKTPGLRNVALTAPYMHNGGMATLEDVLDFYNAGGGKGLGLDVPNQTLPPDSLGLSSRDRDDVIAFLKSLTDTAGFGAQAPAR